MTTLLSRYTIIELIGSGGFGDTYLGEDEALPGKPLCVVKRLKPNPDPNPKLLEEAKRLFDREARVLHELGKNDQIPRLFANFQINEDFYLVQEFIEGHDLRQEIIDGIQLSEQQVIELLK